RQQQRSRGDDRISDLLPTQPSSQFHGVGQLQFLDPNLDQVAHWSIANEQQSKRHALFLQLCYRLEEQQVSLLLSQSRYPDQTRVVGNAVSSGLQQVLAQATVNHLHLFPVLDSAPPKQLASTEVADCNHEGGALDLFANGQLFRAVELLRPMH